MNKKLIMLSLAALVVPLLVLADVCPTGYHWDKIGQDTTKQGECNNWSQAECTEWSTPQCVGYEQVWNEGWNEQGECNSWAEPVCGSYHWGWNNGQFTWHRHCQSPVCNGYEQIWHEGYYTQGECNQWTKATCLNSTEPVCLGYEQIVIEGEGVCDKDHEGSPNYKSNETGQTNGAVNWYILLPQVVYTNAKVWTGQWLNWVQITWLTSQMSTSRVVYGEVSQDYAINQFGYPYLGGKVLVNGTNPMNGTNYGYQHTTAEITDMATYHEVFIPYWQLKPNTTYYYRVVSHEVSRDEFVSREFSFRTY